MEGKLKVFSANIAEACDDSGDEEEQRLLLNLTTNVNLDVISTLGSSFLQPSIEETEGLLDDKIEESYAELGSKNSPQLCTHAWWRTRTADNFGYLYANIY